MTRLAIDDLTLRSMGPFDLAVAAAVHAGCFDEPWRESAISELLAMPGSRGILACTVLKPVGLVIALAVGIEGEILTLGVLPAFRRKGIASRLLRDVTSRLVRVGCRRLLLEVAHDNQPALALYERAGFLEIGRRPAYYRRGSGATMAAIVLARSTDTGLA